MVHYSQFGKVLWTVAIADSITEFSMLKNDEVVLSDKHKNTIDIISLKTYEKRSASVSAKEGDLTKVFTFLLSRMLALVYQK